MKLSHKLFGSFALLLVLTAVLGLFAIRTMGVLGHDVRDLTTNWLPSVQAVAKLDNLINIIRRSEMAHALTEDDAQMRDYEKRLDASLAELSKAMPAYEKLISEPEERLVYTNFQEEWKRYMVLHDKLIAHSKKNETKEAQAIVAGESTKVMTTIQGQLQRLTEINAKGAADSSKEAEETFAFGRALIIGILLAAVVAGAVIALLLIRNVLGQLGEDPGYLQSVSGEVAAGNLDVRFKPVTGQGGVYGVIVKMVDTLKAKIAEADAKTQEAARQSQAAQEATARAEEATRMAERAKAEGMLQAATQLEGVVRW